MRFSGKVISVTGGGSGLGEAIVKRLAGEGALVAVMDIDLAAAERVASEAGSARAYRADVTDAAGMVEAFGRVIADHGRLDGAVNNAGIGGPFIPTADYPLDWWDRTLAINLTGVFHSLRAELPLLAAGGGGAIVNMSSICGLIGQAGTAAYVAAKHAVIGLTKTVALEYGAQNIRCNAVCPTYVQTPLTLAELKDPAIWTELDARHATGHCASPEDVAAMTAFLLSSDARSVTGSAHLVDGGITAS
ncbi:SDR family NAD(P)-dependent oxidoreductase [Novosphingobium lentum]|uniref:SDR family NAD(P)-dependent oxidoreductase n=1 Tax=Novosphingobium lentum TaxID=145287 RepID=UPI00082B67E0|nr:SDR family oxidoreductase [Novosphingobium lentum]